MKHAVLTASGLCMFAAVCVQMMGGSRFVNTVRFVFGLEFVWVMVVLIQELANTFA